MVSLFCLVSQVNLMGLVLCSRGVWREVWVPMRFDKKVKSALVEWVCLVVKIRFGRVLLFRTCAFRPYWVPIVAWVRRSGKLLGKCDYWFRGDGLMEWPLQPVQLGGWKNDGVKSKSTHQSIRLQSCRINSICTFFTTQWKTLSSPTWPTERVFGDNFSSNATGMHFI